MAEHAALPYAPHTIGDTYGAPDAPDYEQWELLSMSTSSVSPTSPRDLESQQHSSGDEALLADTSGHESSVQMDGGERGGGAGRGYLTMDWKEPLHWFCDGNGGDDDVDHASGPVPHGLPGSQSSATQVCYGQEEENAQVSTSLMVVQAAIPELEAMVTGLHASSSQGNDEGAGNPRSQGSYEGAGNPRSQGSYGGAGNPRALSCEDVNPFAETETPNPHDDEGMKSLEWTNPHHHPHTDVALNAAPCRKLQKNAAQPRSQRSRAIWKIAIASSLFGLLMVGHYCQGKPPQSQHLRPEPSAALHP